MQKQHVVLLTFFLALAQVVQAEDYAPLVSAGGRCLDMGDNKNGGRIQTWDCHGGQNQLWYLDGQGHVVNAKGRCLDVSAPEMHRDGGKVQMWECLEGANQKWKLDAEGRLINDGGKCLDVDGPYLYRKGGAVQVWRCNDAPNQRWWYLGKNPPGTGNNAPVIARPGTPEPVQPVPPRQATPPPAMPFAPPGGMGGMGGMGPMQPPRGMPFTQPVQPMPGMQPPMAPFPPGGIPRQQPVQPIPVPPHQPPAPMNPFAPPGAQMPPPAQPVPQSAPPQAAPPAEPVKPEPPPTPVNPFVPPAGMSGMGAGMAAMTGNQPQPPLKPVPAEPDQPAAGNGDAEPAPFTGIVAEHNKWRQEVGVPALKWSDKVAAYAQDWANVLQTQYGHEPFCGMHHRMQGRLYGENLAAATRDMNARKAVSLWADERHNYNNVLNSCQPGKVCGHYTQMVWGASHEIGCGEAKCRDGSEVWVCNYNPPGNFIGRKPY